jgi:hypothetical protein
MIDAYRIKELVDDAEHLMTMEPRRSWGALTLALVSVAASSRRRNPVRKKGRDPKKWLPGARSDGEAFNDFLGPYAADKKLYPLYRNAMIHEGKLPENVLLSPGPLDANAEFVIDNYRGTISINHGYVMWLLEAVRSDPINAAAFGHSVQALVRRDWPAHDEEISKALADESTPPTRVVFLRQLVRELAVLGVTPNTVAAMSDADIDAQLARILPDCNGGNVTGLVNFIPPLAAREPRRLTAEGVTRLKRLAALHKFVVVEADDLPSLRSITAYDAQVTSTQQRAARSVWDLQKRLEFRIE